MTTDELRMTLALQGWVALRWFSPLLHWGMSNSAVGSVHEDAWDAKHGPSVAKTVSSSFVIHQHQPELEIPWRELPDAQLAKLADKAKELGWLSL